MGCLVPCPEYSRWNSRSCLPRLVGFWSTARTGVILMTVLRQFLPVLLLIAVLACGSGDGSTAGKDDGGAGETSKVFADRLIANPDGNYSIDDLVSVGYKKSKQFETDTLPNAQEVWYGFFRQRDIEVWVYENHEIALEFGVDPAEAAILRGRGQDLGPTVLARYTAYAVFGNLVTLCQLELPTCEALIAELDRVATATFDHSTHLLRLLTSTERA